MPLQRSTTKRSDRSPARAFTLLEMLVAMAIMAVLAGSLYATLRVAFRARRSATSAVEEVRTVDLALARVQADIASAVVPAGILAGAFVGEPGTDAVGRAADSLLLHGTATGAEATDGTGDIRMVEFTCAESDDDTGLVLLRRVTTNLLAPTTPEPEEEVLARGVAAFALRYFDGIDWLDTWDSTTQDNQLPAAVEVTLYLRAPGDEAAGSSDAVGYGASRVFLVPCSRVEPGIAMEVPLL